MWNDKLHKLLSDNNFVQSKIDACLYSKGNNEKKIYVVIYVDDFLIASSDINKIN